MKEPNQLVVGVLGLGAIGSRAAEALVRAGVRPENVRAVERASNRADIARLGLTPVSANAIGHVDVLLVAVKPDQVEEAVRQARVEGDPAVVSLMARVSLAELERLGGTPRVARIMTTTPCEIGLGVGAWMPGPGLDAEGRELVERVASALGTHVEAARETEFAVATALSSMSGMVFLILQYFAEALLYVGAPKRYLDLVVPLVESACAYRRHRADAHPVALADEVTSSGGTTIRLRHRLHQGAVAAAIMDGVKAAADRAAE